MSIQYSHKLYYIPAGDPYQDSNGDWVNPSESTTWLQATGLSTDCREEPQDSGKGVVVVDGVKVEFTSMVFAKLSIPNLRRGDRVKIEHNGSTKLETTVKRFSREHYHCLIWL